MHINSLWKPLLVLAAASLMAGCATTKIVTIKTVPENATVSIGGAAAVPGQVNQKLTFNPSSATIEATAHLDGYQDGSIQISYEPSKQKKYLIQLMRFQKTVQIESEPSGAIVLINGQSQGVAPLVTNLTFADSNQPITVKLQKDGYLDGTIQIAYTPADQKEYTVQLSRFHKTVHLQSDPAGATVFLNGQPAGITPLTKDLTFDDANQSMAVTVRKEGYKDGTVQIAYAPVSQTEYTVQLSRFQKTVRVQSDPVGATVFLNGQPAGITPLTKDLTFDNVNQSIAVTVRKEGYKDGTNTISYAPVSQTEYSVTLEKIEAIPMTLVEVGPQPTDNGVKLALTRKPTLAYLEVIERSPNVAAVTRVTDNQDKGVNIGPPILSPTDDVLLFTAIVEEDNGAWYSNIQEQRVGSFGITRLTYGKWHDAFPAYTPDGTNVVFSSNRTSSNPTLWQVKSDGPGGLTKLTYTQAEDYSPFVAPDNRTIVFASNPPGAEEPQIWMLSRDNNLLTQLREGETPRVSPDGKRILFVRQDKLSKRHQLWVMSIDGASETQLSQNTDYDIIDARWSPDGKWIVYASDEGFDSHNNRNYDIWLMTANGSQRTQLTTNGSLDDSPCWDHEGKTIYFRSNRGGAWNIWRFEPILSAE
ncbi:MAG TPA: PEGA domain-containing protein [Verrucomicrobiae bacterium]